MGSDPYSFLPMGSDPSRSSRWVDLYPYPLLPHFRC
jgi:hypothetical protein